MAYTEPLWLEPAYYSWLLGNCDCALFLHKFDTTIIWLCETMNSNQWCGYVKLNLLVAIKSVFPEPQTEAVLSKAGSLPKPPLNPLLLDITLLSSGLSPGSNLSLCLSYLTATGTLVQEHRCLLERQRAKWESIVKNYLFLRLFIYFLPPLPCRLRVVHGSGGPGERDERFVSEDVWANTAEWRPGLCGAEEYSVKK